MMKSQLSLLLSVQVPFFGTTALTPSWYLGGFVLCCCLRKNVNHMHNQITMKLLDSHTLKYCIHPKRVSEASASSVSNRQEMSIRDRGLKA